MELHEKYKTLFNSYHVNTPLRIAHIMAQLEAESGLKPIEENLKYSPKRLGEVFPKYFPNAEVANFYAKSPAMIGARIYANRMGNGDEKSMDGYKFRGRGFIQTTGKNNYLVLSKDTRIDFVTNPDMLLQEANAMIAALHYWSKGKLNTHADNDDVDAISDIINIGHHTAKVGDANGFKHRKELLGKWKTKLGI